MVFINIAEVIFLLSEIRKERIIITEHTKKRLIERNLDEKWIYECLINQEIKGILEQRDSRESDYKYKVLYEHPVKQKYDIIIVFAIANLSERSIRIITTYKQERVRRVRNGKK